MRFLKEKKSIIISFIIGLILASSVTVYAVINASDVTYKDNKSVEDALNDLYSNMNQIANDENKKKEADIYVSTTGNDNNNGSKSNPYLTITKAIQSAVNGSKIYIMPGTYSLEPTRYDEYGCGAINDLGKKIEIFGDNKNTTLILDATSSTYRDCSIAGFRNPESVLRNLIFEYTPKSGENYQKSLFKECSGTIKNVFFRIKGNNAASNLYYNGETINNMIEIENCTFYYDLGRLDNNYTGYATYKNIAANININVGNNTYEQTPSCWKNIVIDSFGNNTDSTNELINKSKVSQQFMKNRVGVFFGEYAWK